MKNIIRILCLLILVWGASAAGAKENTITVAGTGDGQDLFQALATAFEKSHPGKKVLIPPSIDSSGGIRATAQGQCDLGRVARPPRESEARFGLSYRDLARVPIAFVIHPSVTGVENLDFDQVKGILKGKINNWSQVGGPDHKIYVVQRESGDATRRVMGKSLPGYKKTDKFVGFIAYSSKEATEAVRNNKFTFGYMTWGAARASGLRILKIEGVSPGSDSIVRGKYKLIMTVGYVWKSDLKGLSKEFFDFSFSPAGRKALSRAQAVLVE